jgi:CRISPR-associated protein Csd2
MTQIYLDPTKKHDAILLFDCLDGNPNGDPDAGNQPRIDPQTNQGLVTDACLKRKVRNYVEMVGKDESTPEKYKIFVEEGSVLTQTVSRAYTQVGLPEKTSSVEDQQKVADWMQRNYYDLRMFGAVLAAVGLKAGQSWGATQFSFARSIDPVIPQSISITRCAANDGKEGKDNKTMGRKEVIPYGLYKSHIFYNPHLAEKTGCITEYDLKLLWDALVKCWEFDRSASRGLMACRGLYIFSHDNKYGSAPVHELFDKLEIKSTVAVPRSFTDYQVILSNDLPHGVTLTKLA